MIGNFDLSLNDYIVVFFKVSIFAAAILMWFYRVYFFAILFTVFVMIDGYYIMKDFKNITKMNQRRVEMRVVD